MERLGWKGKAINELTWKGLLCRYVEQTQGDFAAGDLVALSSLQPGLLRFSDEIAFCWGPDEEGDNSDITGWMWRPYQSRVWMTFRDSQGQLRLAKSNKEHSGWDEIRPLVYAPSGSHFPSIAFDGDGLLAVAIELNPAQGPGGADSEVWFYHRGEIGYVAHGTRPVLVRTVGNDLLCFYHTHPYEDDNTVIRYRSWRDNWQTEYTLPTEGVGPKRLLAVLPCYQVHDDWPYRSVHLAAFYQHQEEDLARYLVSELLQNEPAIFLEEISPAWQPNVVWTDRLFTVTFIVTDVETGLAVAGAKVAFVGLEVLTDDRGVAVIRAGIPSGPVPFLVTHPEYMQNGWAVVIDSDDEVPVSLIPQPDLSEGIVPVFTPAITWVEIALFEPRIEEPVPLGMGIRSLDLVAITIVQEWPAEVVVPGFKAASILWTEVGE